MSDHQTTHQTTQPDVPIWLRPESSGVGRPAGRSRAEITAAAIGVADREGIDAVSMRRVGAELGTGAASLYRYVATREDLLELMIDAVGAEYDLEPPSGDWLADLVGVGRQGREIMLRHRWLPTLMPTRATLGPNGAALLEHVLTVLADHPAPATAKLEGFAVLNAVVALLAQDEIGGGAAGQHRTVQYLQHVAADGRHPRIAQMMAEIAGAAATPEPSDPFDRVLARLLGGLLGTTPA
jgi:AcrR family transcriptional regulator